MWKNCKVVLLPTNEEAVICGVKELHYRGEHPQIDSLQNQHLYVTSDEEIKEYERFLNSRNELCVGRSNYAHPKCDRKIIATTDKSLDLPQLSQQFIEKYIEEYNKGNVITEVMVEYIEKIHNLHSGANAQWEEEILKVNSKENTITIKKVKDSWNREEHSKSLSDLGRDLSRKFNLPFEDSFKFTMKWIEENL